MKIRYNIADSRKIDYPRFILLSCILVAISIGFLLVGAIKLSATAKQFQDKKKELRACQDQKNEKNQKNLENKKEIENIKTRWKQQRNFANGMIDRKMFPFLERLNKLEELLPAGVYISKLELDSGDKTKVQFHIAAISSAKLLEAYKTFLKYNLVISNETQSEGLYRASLQVNLEK